MFKYITGLFSGGPYYLRISRERVSIRDMRSNKTFECRPILGIDGTEKVVSVGDPVSRYAVRKIEPFNHPRVLVDDFRAARLVVQYALTDISGMKFLRPSPVVLAHADLELAGGLTEIEARALREMVEHAGARKTLIYHGKISPSDDDLREILGSA